MRLFLRFAKLNKVIKASVFFLSGLFVVILVAAFAATIYYVKTKVL